MLHRIEALYNKHVKYIFLIFDLMLVQRKNAIVHILEISETSLMHNFINHKKYYCAQFYESQKYSCV